MKKSMMVLGMAVVMGACGGQTTEPLADGAAVQEIQLSDTVRLKVGEAARVQGAGVLIRLEEIVADSRCPIDALCVHAGDAVVGIGVSGRSDGTLRLHANGEPKRGVVGDVAVRLLEVAPAPVSTRPTLPAEYSVSLEVSHR